MALSKEEVEALMKKAKSRPRSYTYARLELALGGKLFPHQLAAKKRSAEALSFFIETAKRLKTACENGHSKTHFKELPKYKGGGSWESWWTYVEKANFRGGGRELHKNAASRFLAMFEQIRYRDRQQWADSPKGKAALKAIDFPDRLRFTEGRAKKSKKEMKAMASFIGLAKRLKEWKGSFLTEKYAPLHFNGDSWIEWWHFIDFYVIKDSNLSAGAFKEGDPLTFARSYYTMNNRYTAWIHLEEGKEQLDEIDFPMDWLDKLKTITNKQVIPKKRKARSSPSDFFQVPTSHRVSPSKCYKLGLSIKLL